MDIKNRAQLKTSRGVHLGGVPLRQPQAKVDPAPDTPQPSQPKVIGVRIPALLDEEFRLTLIKFNNLREGEGKPRTTASAVVSSLIGAWLEDPTVVCGISLDGYESPRRGCSFVLSAEQLSDLRCALATRGATSGSGRKSSSNQLVCDLVALWVMSDGTCVTVD